MWVYVDKIDQKINENDTTEDEDLSMSDNVYYDNEEDDICFVNGLYEIAVEIVDVGIITYPYWTFKCTTKYGYGSSILCGLRKFVKVNEWKHPNMNMYWIQKIKGIAPVKRLNIKGKYKFILDLYKKKKNCDQTIVDNYGSFQVNDEMNEQFYKKSFHKYFSDFVEKW